MVKGYWIAHVDVTDLEGYKDYQPPTQSRSANTARAFWCAAASPSCLRASCDRVTW